jgi:predicted alpha/beta-hydrolase family hydrolase
MVMSHISMEHEFLHKPDKPNGAGVVLTHGAGGDCRAALIVAAAEALCAAGLTVLRYDLPFRRRIPFRPPSPAIAGEDRAGLKNAVGRMRGMVAGPVYLAGHSYGGRQASMLAAEETELVEGLLLFSYPLHPPNKPQQLRTAHFASLQTPAVFVHGTKDPFGTAAELEEATELIHAPVRLVKVDGAGHDLKKGKFDMSPLAGYLESFVA